MDTLIVFSFNEDGDPPSMDEMSKAEFMLRLKENYYGKDPQFMEPGTRIDTGCFAGLIVIEGQVVKPKPIKTVTEYTI